MSSSSKILNWQSLCEYFKEDHDTAIPAYDSDQCVLVVRPAMGLELQMRGVPSFSTNISMLPELARFRYEKAKTADYSYLALKCEVPDLLEAVLDFYYSVASNIVKGKQTAKDSIIKSYEQYKAILSQRMTASRYTLQGMWGELYALSLIIENPLIDSNSLVLNWTGPQGQPNDFSFGKTAIEIKTTLRQTNVVEISSFEQLDAEQSWIIIIHAFHALPQDGGKSIDALALTIAEKLTSTVKEILYENINLVLNSISVPSCMKFSMKPYGVPIIVEIDNSIPVLNRSLLTKVFGENRAKLIEKGKYVLDLSSVEYSHKKIDEVFLEAQRYDKADN